MKNTLSALFLIPFLLLFNCKNREPRTINTAVFHWKSQLNISDFEQSYCKEIKANTLYLRLFDVDFNAINKFPEPIGELNLIKNKPINFDKIIPTIFITNRTLINTQDNKIDSLTALIFNKIVKSTEGVVSDNKFQEILIDCDWTETTKDKFFHLIKQLKTISNKKIATTIRLHQIKYRDKTGVPPADRGVLMAYNTSDLADPQTINSILNIEVLKSYLTNLKTYPLDLDVALPIFSWGIVKRDGQAVQLIPNFSKGFLVKKDENMERNDIPKIGTEGVLFQEKSSTEIEILKSRYFNGIYLYADDVIKIEEVSLNDLQLAATILSQHIRNQQVMVSFFSLDSVNLKRYNSSDLLEIANRFK